MALVRILLGIVAGLLALVVIWYTRELRRAGQRIKHIVQGMDDKYETYIHQTMTLATLEDQLDSLDYTQVTAACMTLLQVDIDALIAHVNSLDTLLGVRVHYDSRYFHNLVSLMEKFMSSEHKKQTPFLQPSDEDQIITQVQNAVQSDLTRRMMELKVGQ